VIHGKACGILVFEYIYDDLRKSKSEYEEKNMGERINEVK